MHNQTPTCCPYCQCTEVLQSKEVGLIEIGASEFDQIEEDIPVDIWTCSECQRRFFVTGIEEDDPK